MLPSQNLSTMKPKIKVHNLGHRLPSSVPPPRGPWVLNVVKNETKFNHFLVAKMFKNRAGSYHIFIKPTSKNWSPCPKQWPRHPTLAPTNGSKNIKNMYKKLYPVMSDKKSAKNNQNLIAPGRKLVGRATKHLSRGAQKLEACRNNYPCNSARAIGKQGAAWLKFCQVP